MPTDNAWCGAGRSARMTGLREPSRSDTRCRGKESMMKSTVARVAVVLALLSVVALAQPAAAAKGWIEDVAKAQAQAEKEGKDLLMDFTGSDWCGWCTKLKKEVFTQEPFATEAPKKFVFVMLDFPRRRKMPASVKAQNAEWRDKLGVRGYPTIILADAKGRPYGKTGYRRGGSEKYMEHLNELQQVRIKRDKLFAQAARSKGTAKAKLLDKAVADMSQALVLSCYGETVDEIIKLDPNDKAGLKSKYADARASVKAAEIISKIEAKVRPLAAKKDHAGALKIINKAFADLKPVGQAAQNLYMLKSYTLFTKGDKAGAKAALEAGIKAAPKGEKAEMMKRVIRQYFSGDKKQK